MIARSKTDLPVPAEPVKKILLRSRTTISNTRFCSSDNSGVNSVAAAAAAVRDEDILWFAPIACDCRAKPGFALVLDQLVSLGFVDFVGKVRLLLLLALLLPQLDPYDDVDDDEESS